MSSRYRGSKMWSGTCSVGNRTIPSGNSPISIGQAYAHGACEPGRGFGLLHDEDRDGREQSENGDESHVSDPMEPR